MLRSVIPISYFFLLLLPTRSIAQQIDNVEIKKAIENYKQDTRGPYKDIRWFCKDGSTLAPKEKCQEPGGVQRARYKDEVIALAGKNHVFLGQILSTTDNKAFRDEENNHSRLKQYQLEKYLRSVDDGWVLRKAQFYRGAFQIEDEDEWGINFFHWFLADDDVIRKHFFLVRQAAKDIPHRIDDNKTQNVRAVSKNISDAYPAFMGLRVKIHGQPDASDIKKVKIFREQHKEKLNPELLKKLDELVVNMELVYQPVNINSLTPLLLNLPKDSERRKTILQYADEFNQSKGKDKMFATSNMMWYIRENILMEKSGKARLALLDISNKLEEILSREVSSWKAGTLEELMDKINYICQAAAGCGFLEIWEWKDISVKLMPPTKPEISLAELTGYYENARRTSEWSTGMVRALYLEVITLYSGFEHKVNGYSDEIIRSSILLHLGQSISRLGDVLSIHTSFYNKVMNIPNQGVIRGMNPGYATGELVVVEESSNEIEVAANKIYVFKTPPSDLKPVAGIMTVSEGNPVSHVQLLARNLGIPNSVISLQNFEDIKKLSEKKVFYAVSNKNTVIMKPIEEMTEEEKQLFAIKKRNEEKIKVPVNKINLQQTVVLNLRDINAQHSGKLCGPKAANLGQLKSMFPAHVVEGIVIPFGIFRKHLDQTMPGQTVSYWQYMNGIFEQAETMRKNGQDETAVENYVLKELETFRNAIIKIKLNPEFLVELKKYFKEVFGKDMGSIPVFVRSDTNMEDLKDFTGAGLNLTIFNVVAEEKILQGIKDVWASPYSERSYKWRQRLLLNPENVFPSILIIPSVNVDYSGVMITKGIVSGNDNDITVAFSRGAGGAVEGQAAETWLLKNDGGKTLLMPAREPAYNSLPETGGTKKKYTTFDNPILNAANMITLKNIASEIKQKLPLSPGIESKGPFDIEMGFKNDKLWLFQVRPFVENKKAASSSYLQSITPVTKNEKMIPVNSKI
ncbi:MAG: PEP/pyruvate-binding domain-containing protein [Bacteroidota bacterium]